MNVDCFLINFISFIDIFHIFTYTINEYMSDRSYELEAVKMDFVFWERLATFYKIFSDNTRLQILYTLQDTELCVGQIATKLSVSPSAISHQLRTLRQLNLVKTQKKGKEVYYSLADHHIQIILEYGMHHIQEGVEQ